jgi:hypothetical protein
MAYDSKLTMADFLDLCKRSSWLETGSSGPCWAIEHDLTPADAVAGGRWVQLGAPQMQTLAPMARGLGLQ